MSGRRVAVALRPFVPDDVPAVAAIERMVSAEPWSSTLFAGEFEVAPETRHWLVAESGGQIVGFGGMMFVAGEGHVMNIAVHPEHQRRGIARQLCAALFVEAKRRGATALTLEVRTSNAAAQALYRSFAMVPVGARKDYYTNPDGSKEDGLIYWFHDLQDRDVPAGGDRPGDSRPEDDR